MVRRRAAAAQRYRIVIAYGHFEDRRGASSTIRNRYRGRNRPQEVRNDRTSDFHQPV